MRVVFMSGGAREPALQHLLENSVNVVAVVTPPLTDSNRRFEPVIGVAERFQIPHITVTRESLHDKLEALEPDILLSCGFTLLMPQRTIDLAAYALNVHPTLLPRYRGFRSGPYILINGETESGVTVHRLEEAMDAGDILVQRAFEVTPFDTTRSVMRKTRELEPTLILEAIRLVESGTAQFTPQDESKATVFEHLRTPADSEVDANASLHSLYNSIRACDADDYPAFFRHAGQKIYIKLWTRDDERPDRKDDEI